MIEVPLLIRRQAIQVVATNQPCLAAPILVLLLDLSYVSLPHWLLVNGGWGKYSTLVGLIWPRNRVQLVACRSKCLQSKVVESDCICISVSICNENIVYLLLNDCCCRHYLCLIGH